MITIQMAGAQRLLDHLSFICIFYYYYLSVFEITFTLNQLSKQKSHFCTGYLKRICSPDDYNTDGRCTETFWSPFIYLYILLLLLLFICIWDVHSTLNQLTKQKSYLCTGWSKSVCSPDDHNTEGRCTETFWSPFIYPYILLLLFICIWDVHSTLNQLTKQKSYLWTGRSKRIRSPDDYNTEGRCKRLFDHLLFICICYYYYLSVYEMYILPLTS